MKTKALFALGTALLLAIPASAIGDSPRDRVTGGGQILFSSDGTGPGSTIAFTAQQFTEGAQGQVQIVDRSAGTGQDQVRFHGVVDCLTVEGNMAKIGGAKRRGGQRFTVVVVDNGEGGEADADMIFFNYSSADPDCTFEDEDDEDLVALARGNAQVHDAE